ncbi:unnamed protein product [Arctogadus glacialis]
MLGADSILYKTPLAPVNSWVDSIWKEGTPGPGAAGERRNRLSRHDAGSMSQPRRHRGASTRRRPGNAHRHLICSTNRPGQRSCMSARGSGEVTAVGLDGPSCVTTDLREEKSSHYEAEHLGGNTSVSLVLCVRCRAHSDLPGRTGSSSSVKGGVLLGCTVSRTRIG